MIWRPGATAGEEEPYREIRMVYLAAVSRSIRVKTVEQLTRATCKTSWRPERAGHWHDYLFSSGQHWPDPVDLLKVAADGWEQRVQDGSSEALKDLAPYVVRLGRQHLCAHGAASELYTQCNTEV